MRNPSEVIEHFDENDQEVDDVVVFIRREMFQENLVRYYLIYWCDIERNFNILHFYGDSEYIIEHDRLLAFTEFAPYFLDYIDMMAIVQGRDVMTLSNYQKARSIWKRYI